MSTSADAQLQAKKKHLWGGSLCPSTAVSDSHVEKVEELQPGLQPRSLMTWSMADGVSLVPLSQMVLTEAVKVHCLFLPSLSPSLPSSMCLYIRVCIYLFFSCLLQTYHERRHSSVIKEEMKTCTLGER